MKKMIKILATTALLGAVGIGTLSATATSVSEVDAATTTRASTGTLVIKKLNDSNKPVSGTVFKIYAVTGQYVKQVTTDRNGVATTALAVGSYNIVDVAAAGSKGSIMYYVPVAASATKTALFDKAYRALNGIY